MRVPATGIKPVLSIAGLRCYEVRERAPARSGGSLAQSLLRSVQLGGGEQLLVRGLLAAQADRVARQLGQQSQGSEARAANAAAVACGATVVLGEP